MNIIHYRLLSRHINVAFNSPMAEPRFIATTTETTLGTGGQKSCSIPVSSSCAGDSTTPRHGLSRRNDTDGIYNSIEAGHSPDWEFALQLFPDDGTFVWNGIDLIQATQIVPFAMNPPIKLGKLTLNRNPTNFFAEPESISFAPSNVVGGISFVLPDPILQWRLMLYDDTATHRHNGPNGYLLPINKAIAPINNNYRDGYMQPLLFEGASASTPHGIDGAQEASANQTLAYTSSAGQSASSGPIGRYAATYDWVSAARTLWSSFDVYDQQHTVDAYRFELGHVSDPNVTANYISSSLNPIDNCLERHVAYGIGSPLPPICSGPRANSTSLKQTTPSPDLYRALTPSLEPNKSNARLTIGIIADSMLSAADLSAVTPLLAAQSVSFEVVAPHIGPLASGVNANQSYVTTSSIY